MPFTLYGVTGFELQYWTGSTWTDIPGGDVTRNNHVWRQFTFANITTTKIRVLINNSLASYSRVTEIEAYNAGANPTPTLTPTATPTPTLTPTPTPTATAAATATATATATANRYANRYARLRRRRLHLRLRGQQGPAMSLPPASPQTGAELPARLVTGWMFPRALLLSVMCPGTKIWTLAMSLVETLPG